MDEILLEFYNLWYYQFQEALEISRKELSGNTVHNQVATRQEIPEKGANSHNQMVLSNPKKSEGILLHLNAFFEKFR